MATSHASSAQPREGQKPMRDAASQSPLSPGERWYVAMTLPHKERYAAANLSNQGFRLFLPLQSRTFRHGRRFYHAIAPVFPRYLFVALNVDARRWRSINGTFGVRYLICQGGCPLPVPVGAVEALLQGSDVDGRLIAGEDVLAAGQGVRILSGSFVGLSGIVQRLEGAERVQLLLEIMGAVFVVTAPRETVTPV